MAAVDELRRFIGERLSASASAWHEYEGARGADPSDTWSTFGSVTVNLRGAPHGQDMAARVAEVESGCDMQEYGRVVVAADTPPVVAHCVGQLLQGVSELGFAPWPGEPVGLVLEFTNASIAFFNVSDETKVVPWTPQAAEEFALVALHA